ncbi:MAG: FtsQ-type POTRA domain-containing protein [Gammaproteobacteria bacterium]|nr:FtsQ-type POTRA domain-containing protein [Gammaproteobacteria bacterium]
MTRGAQSKVDQIEGDRAQVAPRELWRLMPFMPLAGLALLGVILAEGPALARLTGLSAFLPRWPIEAVTVTGEMRQVSRDELTARIAATLSDDFFSVDVRAIRVVAAELPWIEEVAVRKIWPDKLHVQVRERQAVARWDSGGLIAADGTLFFPKHGHGIDVLPVLAGPDGTQRSAQRRLLELRSDLGAMGLTITRVVLDPHSGMNVWLNEELELVLGHDFSRPRLREMAMRIPAMLGDRLSRVARIDLRYANGFAVRWLAPGPSLAIGEGQ